MDIRWQKVEEAVCGALEIPLDDRSSWLDKFCDGDASLRADIESLLSVQPAVEAFLEHSVAPYAGILLEQDETPAAPAKVGQYRVLNELGRGGMGVVYLAEREDQFHQRVAIKLVKRGLDTEDILRRFRNERQILASLNHPNIAKIFDGGMTDDGLPYFVMEYIEGSSLLRYCDQHELLTNERLRLFRRICAAVHHAHQNLIIHRDLKPSNIMVTSEGMVKLLDFGVAKLLAAENGDGAPTQTQAAAQVLTPEYASPEQIRGQHVTTSTDVYSLGVVLYELLTGARPYKLRDRSPAELSRAICESEPTKPSEAGGGQKQRAAAGPPGVRESSKTANLKSLRGDLDNIVLMALRKEPERRYKSVEQFSEDIHRHLIGLPVIARKDTFQYRASKFIGRNKLAVSAAALVLFAILGGAIVSIWQARVAARERIQAQQEQAKAEQLNKFLQSILLSASPEAKGKDAKVIEVVHDAVERLKTEFENQPTLKAQALLTIGVTYNSLGLGDEAIAILREALQLNSTLYGDESKEAGTCMIELSLPLLNKNKIEEAESLLQKGIVVERKLAPNSKELATGLAVLGELNVRKHDYKNAQALQQEALALFDRLAGPNNEDSATTLVSLGRAQYFSGDIAGAEKTYRKSIETYHQLPARFSGRLAIALLNLGLLLTNAGSFDEGVKAIHQADDIFTKQGESFEQFESKAYLCMVYFNHGNYPPAINYGQRAIEIGRKLGVTEANDFLSSQKFVGVSLTRIGRPKDGEPILRENLATTKKVAPEGSVLIATSESALGECLTVQGRFAEAEPLVTRSYESIKASQGEKSALTATAAKRAVTLYEHMRKPVEAAKYRSAAGPS
ncbi:MAG TPA: serine/threonine-protein kinase [Pyrinomonadaceae bacterium]|nr:serine/threonine-protein kinase [Pyrinomonadaceae bacterium]